MKCVAYVLTTIVVLGLPACAEVGNDFVRLDPQAVILAKTTRNEIVRQFGQPASTRQFSKNNQLIDSIHYSYATHDFNSGRCYEKDAWFFFVGDSLVGYMYGSDLPSEQRDFDARRVPSIVKGKTTKAEVVAIFGQPTAFLQFPVTDEKKTVQGDSSILYTFYKLESNFTGASVNKFLQVFFDSNGVSKDVDLDITQKAGILTHPASNPHMH